MEIEIQEMRLTKLLSNVIINEVSQKLANQLLAKFKETTKDSDEIILALINKFDQYKEGITDLSKRDITKYTYDELKNFIMSKEIKKLEDKAFKGLKNKWDKQNAQSDSKIHDYRHDTLKNLIKKFYMIQPYLKKEQQDIMKYGYLDLVGLINDKFNNTIRSKALEHFKKTTQTSPDTIFWYIDTYLNNFNDVPEGTKPLFSMTFEELEHLVDGSLSSMESTEYKNDYSDVDIVYDDNNLIIFAPKTKDHCIKLAHGRSWCTSREGGSNLYYNYRLNNERTLYYVLDKDLPYSDLNFASVILVDPYGGTSLADGSNSGRYSGHNNIPWDEISGKIPKIANLKHLFEPKPLTEKEKELHNKFKYLRIDDNQSIIDKLGSEEMAELWLEVNSPRLSDYQYEHLTPALQKKYIALGFDLTGNQIQSSDQNVLSYYVNKKKEKLVNTPFDRLSGEDIELLATPMMKNVRESMKKTYLQSLTTRGGKEVTLNYPNDNASKFVKLYGMDEFIALLPEDITQLEISNETSSPMNLVLPDSFRRFNDLEIFFSKNAFNEVPDQLRGMKNLQFLGFNNSPNITEIPEWVADLPNLVALILTGSNPNVKIHPRVLELQDKEVEPLNILTS